MPRQTAAARRALVEERRSQILTAAAEVFARKGYERSTIADVARQAGVAEGSIYNYFKSKGDLLISLPRQAIQIPPLTLLSPSGPAEETLTLLSRAMLTTIRQNAPIFRILLTALPSMKKQTREQYLQQVVLYALGMLQKYFADLIERGVLRPDAKPAILARSFVGMFFPFILLHEVLAVEHGAPVDYEEIIASNVRTFLRGAMKEDPATRHPRASE